MSASRYLENQVLGTDRVGLVLLLYEGAMDAIRRARAHLEAGRIAERSNAVTKAMQIVAELQNSLDFERGGSLARGLAELYAFVQERLVEANARQALVPLNQALQTLEVLHRGWKEIQEAQPPPAAQEAMTAGPAGWSL